MGSCYAVPERLEGEEELHNEKPTVQRPIVLIPLYIYPLEGAWEPLVTLARAHPDVLFVTVVNPCNGPGSEPLPDDCYTAALKSMSTVPNIRPVGYVHCLYGKRPADLVKADIDAYRGWADMFRIDGIFIDEAPSDLAHVDYLKDLSDHAKSTWSEHLDHTAHVIYNPGVVVSRLFFESADWVVVFEQAEEHWRSPDIQESMKSLSPDLRPRAVAIVHSLSEEPDEAADLTNEIRQMGLGGLHLTEEIAGGYTKWPCMWNRVAQELSDNSQ